MEGKGYFIWTTNSWNSNPIPKTMFLQERNNFSHFLFETLTCLAYNPALHLAFDLSFQSIILEGDCSSVIKKLKTTTHDRSTIKPLVEDGLMQDYGQYWTSYSTLEYEQVTQTWSILRICHGISSLRKKQVQFPFLFPLTIWCFDQWHLARSYFSL